jgi:ParB-like chromosome segregation protein Spo0J
MTALTDPRPAEPAASIPEFISHDLAEQFPLMAETELRDLAADIRKHGLLEPIILFEGKILDGRNRHRAAKLAGHKFVDANFTKLPPGRDPRAFVSANIHRRHLTAEQKRDLLAKLIKADPTKSDRQIAEQAKVSHHTVGDMRSQLVATGQLAQLETHEGADGKKRCAKNKRLKPELTNSDLYDKAEDRLIERLQSLQLDRAEEAVDQTVKELRKTLATMRAGAQSVAKAA